MNIEYQDLQDVERILATQQPAAPSAGLRQRIIPKAVEAWNASPAHSARRLILRRLGPAAAAALVIVAAGNLFSSLAIARWRSGGRVAAQAERSDSGVLPEVHYAPLVERLVATRRSGARSASAPRHYLERCREMLQEEADEVDRGASAPGEHRSRLLPAHSWATRFS